MVSSNKQILASHPAEYNRRRPERTLLYQLVKKHVPAISHSDDEPSSLHGLPRIVHREFENYLKCGRLENGFVKLACLDCHHSTLVAFSCKGRGFCPSCGARRMSQTAAHLVDNVLPAQPYRQWVLSLPYPLRFLLARDPEVLSLTLIITQQVISRYLTQQASPHVAHTGGVAVVQRFGSALNLNPHFHILMLDGVYIYAKNGQLKFLQSKPPTKEDIQKITIRIAQRVAKALERTGHLVRDDEQGHYLPEQEVDLLGDMQSHSITYRIATGPKKGQKVFQLQLLPPADNGPSSSSSDPIANYAGFNLHAGLKVGSKQRDKLERLCRYLCRPPLAHARLTLTEDEKVAYRLKTPFRSGTPHLFCT
ncbi:MAG: transposase [Bacteroidetes bacterium]|nr:transposase [Bacteroidota bacterium]